MYIQKMPSKMIGPRMANGRFTRNRKPRTKKPKVLSKAVTAVVKHIAAKQALKEMETKFVIETIGNISFNSAINAGYLEMYSLLPAVTQGAGSWQRLDNALTPLSCSTTWDFSLNNTIDRTVDIIVTLYCLQSKSIRYFPNYTVYTSGPSDLLLSGTNVERQNYNGFIGAGELPINTANWSLLKKYTFRLTKNVGTLNDDTTAGNAPINANSYKRIRFNYKCPKQFKYTPNVTTPETYPQGHAPIWVCGYAHADGTGVDNTYTDLNVSYMTQMKFKDA